MYIGPWFDALFFWHFWRIWFDLMFLEVQDFETDATKLA
jgi:hypothetical protein